MRTWEEDTGQRSHRQTQGPTLGRAYLPFGQVQSVPLSISDLAFSHYKFGERCQGDVTIKDDPGGPVVRT